MSFTPPVMSASWAEALAMSRAVGDACAAIVQAKSFLADFRSKAGVDALAPEALSSTQVIQVMVRAGEHRRAVARLLDADVQGFLASNAEALPAGWADAVAGLIADLAAVGDAARKALPVSGDGTLALITVDAEMQVSWKPMQPAEMTEIVEKADVLIAKA